MSSSLRPLKLAPPASNDDDLYLMRELNQLRAIVSEAPPCLPDTLAFSVIFQWPYSSQGKGLAVHFHSMAEAATRTATLYDPTVDDETDLRPHSRPLAVKSAGRNVSM